MGCFFLNSLKMFVLGRGGMLFASTVTLIADTFCFPDRCLAGVVVFTRVAAYAYSSLSVPTIKAFS